MRNDFCLQAVYILVASLPETLNPQFLSALGASWPSWYFVTVAHIVTLSLLVLTVSHHAEELCGPAFAFGKCSSCSFLDVMARKPAKWRREGTLKFFLLRFHRLLIPFRSTWEPAGCFRNCSILVNFKAWSYWESKLSCLFERHLIKMQSKQTKKTQAINEPTK